MIKFNGRGQIKPESYIRAYRKAIREAITLSEASSHGFHLAARIKLADPKAQQYGWNQAIKAGKTPREEKFVGGTFQVIKFNLSDPADCTLWYKCQRGAAWNNVQVDGPGTN